MRLHINFVSLLLLTSNEYVACKDHLNVSHRFNPVYITSLNVEFI